MLEALGYEVRAFESAEEAMARPAGATESFHVVVGERLPGALGWESFVERLGVSGAPVARIAVCGREVSDEEVKAQGLAVLRKPFQLADLRNAILQAGAPREAQT